tara:strand:- start:702 stop:896 length:195 start_codon:yes stop_codon:yes gene_type:complete
MNSEYFTHKEYNLSNKTTYYHFNKELSNEEVDNLLPDYIIKWYDSGTKIMYIVVKEEEEFNIPS